MSLGWALKYLPTYKSDVYEQNYRKLWNVPQVQGVIWNVKEITLI